jgi:hypothetical protein
LSSISDPITIGSISRIGEPEPMRLPDWKLLQLQAIASIDMRLIPARTPLRGKTVELVPQDARVHAADLFSAGHDSEQGLRIWDYLAYGPWASEQDYTGTMRDSRPALTPFITRSARWTRISFRARAAISTSTP